MKTVEKHISRFLVSIAILLVFGNVASAGVVSPEKSKSAVVEILQQDENSKPFVFNEISIGEISQTISQNEYSGAGFVGMFYSSKNFSDAQIYLLFNCSYSSTDKRELIFQYLFPFHFFW